MKSQSSKWHVYILKCVDDTFYTGITNNLEKRLEAHNKGSGAKYTQARTPVRLVYTESSKDRSQATKREIEIKKMSRTEKVFLVEAHQSSTTLTGQE